MPPPQMDGDWNRWRGTIDQRLTNIMETLQEVKNGLSDERETDTTRRAEIYKRLNALEQFRAQVLVIAGLMSLVGSLAVTLVKELLFR